MLNNSPPMIALSRGIETAAIVLLALSIAMTAFVQAIPNNTFPPTIEAEIIAATVVVAGLGKALTAFLSALHIQSQAVATQLASTGVSSSPVDATPVPAPASGGSPS